MQILVTTYGDFKPLLGIDRTRSRLRHFLKTNLFDTFIDKVNVVLTLESETMWRIHCSFKGFKNFTETCYGPNLSAALGSVEKKIVYRFKVFLESMKASSLNKSKDLRKRKTSKLSRVKTNLFRKEVLRIEPKKMGEAINPKEFEDLLDRFHVSY